MLFVWCCGDELSWWRMTPSGCCSCCDPDATTVPDVSVVSCPKFGRGGRIAMLSGAICVLLVDEADAVLTKASWTFDSSVSRLMLVIL